MALPGVWWTLQLILSSEKSWVLSSLGIMGRGAITPAGVTSDPNPCSCLPRATDSHKWCPSLVEKVLRDPSSQIQFILFPQTRPLRPRCPRESRDFRKPRLGCGLISLRSAFSAIPQAWLSSLWSPNQRQRPHFACLPNAVASFPGDSWRGQHLPCAPSRLGLRISLHSVISCPR